MRNLPCLLNRKLYMFLKKWGDLKYLSSNQPLHNPNISTDRNPVNKKLKEKRFKLEILVL